MHLLRGNNNCRDGFTLVLGRADDALTWGATVVDTFASSYISSTSSTPGGAAEAAATRKLSKYSTISQSILILGALEIMEPINTEGLGFSDELSNRLISVFQWLFVLVQWFSMVAFHGTLTSEMDID